jgi:hypothetical protein
MAERIMYPSVDDFYDGIRVYSHYSPSTVYREVRDPRATEMGVTDGTVSHVLRMETFRAYYAIVGFQDPQKQQRSFADFWDTVSKILGPKLKAHRAKT